MYVFYGWNYEKNHKYTEEKGHGKKCLKMSFVAVLSAVVLDHVVIGFFFSSLLATFGDVAILSYLMPTSP